MAVQTKTEQRRQTIRRGTVATASLGEKALARVAVAEVREISSAAHVDSGANTGQDIQAREALAASMAARTYSAPDSASAADIATATDDPRYVPLSLLLSDLRRRTKLHTRGFSRDERSDIATDAALILMRWTCQGSTAPIYLGKRGELPLRREWLDSDKRTVIRDGKSSRPAPNAKAERAMRAAILQAVRDRNGDAESALRLHKAKLETLSADSDSDSVRQSLAAAALAHEQERADLAPCLPDADAPELIADAMGITRDAARTVIARGYRLNPRQCADLWQVSDKRAENILSAGKHELVKRYPDPADLLEALAAAAPEVREALKTRAYRALDDVAHARYWEDKEALAAIAARAVNEYRAAVAELPTERRAIELAAQRIGWTPDAIGASEYVTRLLGAERKRGQRSAGIAGSVGTVLTGSRDAAGRMPALPTRGAAEAKTMPDSGPTTWFGYGNGYSGANYVGRRLERAAKRSAAAAKRKRSDSAAGRVGTATAAAAA